MCTGLRLDQDWNNDRCAAMRALEPAVDGAPDAFFQRVAVGDFIFPRLSQGLLHRWDSAIKIKVLHEPARDEIWLLRELARVRINQCNYGNDALLRQDAPIPKRVFVDHTNCCPVHVYVTGGNFPYDFRFPIDQVDYDPVIADEYALGIHTGADCQFCVGFQMAPFTVNWHYVSGSNNVVAVNELARG